MRSRVERRAWWIIATVLAGVSCVRYEPRPLDPSGHPRDYRARRLEDSALAAWVARYAQAPASDRWTDRQLALAALALRADVAHARADWLAARAAVKSAGTRPPPGVEGDVERAVSNADERSPWVVSLAGLFTVELGGKRGARMQRARAGATITESELVRTAHQVRSGVRASVLAVAHAEELWAEAAGVVEGLHVVSSLERGRFQEAALGSAELARTGADLALARAELAAREGQVAAARAALAGRLALPPDAFRNLRVEPSAVAGCSWLDSLGTDSLLGLAALQRAEVARVLGEYAAAEAEVKLEAARRSPDLELGPGFIWDQGVHRWTLAVALPGLLGLRNRAPLDQAVAARTAAASRVAQVQDTVLAEAGEAAESCRAGLAERSVADSVAAAAERLATLARARYDRGETGALEQARARLALLRATAARRAVERRIEHAGLAVETAAGEWRGVSTRAWPDPRELGLAQ